MFLWWKYHQPSPLRTGTSITIRSSFRTKEEINERVSEVNALKIGRIALRAAIARMRSGPAIACYDE
jgi:hypothetical protein